jgi:hypothetical protein
MKHLKAFESFGFDNKKIEVNGIEISLAKSPFDGNYEIFLPACDEVINIGTDGKFAEAVLNTAKLFAEDGKTAQEICTIIKDKLRNNI